jgi:superoxide reductase
MEQLKELFQSADWKKEKHVPVIEAPDKAKKGEMIRLMVSVGKEIPHPNETKHHIRRISLYFLPKGEKFPYHIGTLEFEAHGESTNGPDTSTVYSEPAGGVGFKTEKSGTLFASSYCNIHGLWQNSKDITIE